MGQQIYQCPRKRQVLVKTEFLWLAEVNHAHVEAIKQSIYESFEQIGM